MLNYIMMSGLTCETCFSNIFENKPWAGEMAFIKRLNEIENILIEKNKYIKIQSEKCLLCNKKIISKEFYIENFKWNDSLSHYIKQHHIKPSDKFIDFIYRFKLSKKVTKRIFKFKSNKYIINDISYVKLKRNQILIMDALLIHGGYTKKYFDKKNIGQFKYSEHYGLLDFNQFSLERVIISGKTNRLDENDKEIYLPKELSNDVLEYEYLFHTHPPTPRPGGRAIDHIIYEFPSPNDIVSFVHLFNKGMTQGSIVMTSEGMYIIRKYNFNKKKIKINDEKAFNKIYNIEKKLQEKAIEKYGINFTTQFFYSTISQDVHFINRLNKTVSKFKLFIDYYPRTKIGNKWIIDTVYLPIFVTTKI